MAHIFSNEEKRLGQFKEQVQSVLTKRIVTNKFELNHIKIIVMKLEGEIYLQMKVGCTPVEVADDLKRQWDNGSLKGKLL